MKQSYAYKYLKEVHLASFKQKGQIRLGTVDEYRIIENNKIQDIHEGRTSYLFIPKDEDIQLTIEEANSINYKYNFAAPLTIKAGGGLSVDLEVPNEHIFCMSRDYDSNAMKTMGYDSVYKITDLEQFNNIIYNKIKDNLELIFWVNGDINYVTSKIHTVTNKNKKQLIDESLRQVKNGIKSVYLDDYFVKVDKFEHENELRTVFVSKAPLVTLKEPFIIDIPELVELCEF